MSNDTALTNAREKALLEEEKWLIENLKKIRAQRNALKVEALYFQGLKAEVFVMHNAQFANSYSQNAGNNSYSTNAGGISYSLNAVDNSYPQNASGNSYSQNTGDNSYSEYAGDDSYSQYAGGESYSPQTAGRNNYTQDEEEFEIPEPVGNTNPSNIDDFNLVEQRCNEIENLNLNIIPDNKPNMDMMEPEYDTDEEERDWYKIQFDMSVLVSGHCNQFQSESNE